MEITWWGTAGFKLKGSKGCLLIDPYLSRNSKARPRLDIKPSSAEGAGAILISHGHFDHLLDVPGLAGRFNIPVFCDSIAAASLVREGLAGELITEVAEDGQALEPAGPSSAIRVRAFFSRHVDFDVKLVLTTLAKINFRLPKYLPLTKKWPHGQVLSWRVEVEGRIIHHFGSAGSPPEELDRLAGLARPDILLMPLQGNSRICDIALNYVRVLKPRLVIPHHQDDFYPPISQQVDIRPFTDGLKGMKDVDLKVLEPGQPWKI